MNRDEQKEFIVALCRNVAEKIAAQIDDGKIPGEWDGHELRVLMADNFDDVATISLIRREPRCVRARDYRNEVLTKNLI